MRHSVDGQQERERPNLLLKSNRNSIPTINILSSLENHQNLKSSGRPSRKKIWGLALLIILAIGGIDILLFGNLQNLTRNSKLNLPDFLAPANSADPGKAIPSNANHPPVAQDTIEPKALTLSITDEEKNAQESSAVLIDVAVEKEKVESLNAALSNSKSPEPSIPASPEAHSVLPTANNSKAQDTHVKAITPEPKVAIQKQVPKREIETNKKDKDLLKTRAIAEKNDAKAFDSDVALLSALVANTSKSKEHPSGNMVNIANTKTSIAPPINLDVIERNPGDNTKSLLSRCEKLGGAEAKLCHDRICAGSRQSETVCALSND